MRLMIIDPDERRGQRLAGDLAGRYGWPTRSAQDLAAAGPGAVAGDFILDRPPVDEHQAARLEETLTAADTPLDLVFLIEDRPRPEQPGPYRSDAPPGGRLAAQAELRRLRAEGGMEDLAHALVRIIDDAIGRETTEADAFDRLLESLTRRPPPTAVDDGAAAHTPPRPSDENTPPMEGTIQAKKPPRSNWKRTTQDKRKTRRRGSGWKPKS